MMNCFKAWFSKKYARTIHCEAYYQDDIYRATKKYLLKHKKIKVFVMAPCNSTWFYHMYFPNMPPEELDKVMSERVIELKKMGLEIGLHVHLSQFGSLPEEEERVLVIFSKKWLESLGITPKYVQFGWYQNTSRLRKLCNKLNLEIYPRQKWRNIHDFNLIK